MVQATQWEEATKEVKGTGKFNIPGLRMLMTLSSFTTIPDTAPEPQTVNDIALLLWTALCG